MTLARGGRSPWVARVLLVLCLLCIYNANLRQVSSLDTYASRLVPIALLRHGELTLDRFFPDLAGDHPDGYVSTYLYRTNGHLYDSHPPIGSLLTLPIYAIPVWLGVPEDVDAAGNLLSKLAASSLMAFASLTLVVALSSVAGRSGRHRTGRRGPEQLAMGAVLMFALGTSVWSAASQAIWTHTPAVFGYAMALWGIVGGWGVVAGVGAGLAAVARPATAPAALLLIGYLVHRAVRSRVGGHPSLADERRQAIGGVLGLGVVATAGVMFNLVIFGRVGGGAAGRTTNWVEAFGASSMFEGSLMTGLAGLTISPSRGILIYSPIVLLAAAGGYRVWRTALDSLPAKDAQDDVLLGRYATVAVVVTLLTYAQYLVWWGGHGFGSRYMTDVMPMAALLFVFGMADPGDALPSASVKSVTRPVVRSLALVTLCVYSIGIQAVGAFCWPARWTLDGSASYVNKLWDWRDSQIVSCLRSGPRVDPMARRVFERLGL